MRNQLAVALHYDKAGAPRVVAKGRGGIGKKIIEIAKAHDIPIEENEVLAGALANVELGDEIPAGALQGGGGSAGVRSPPVGTNSLATLFDVIVLPRCHQHRRRRLQLHRSDTAVINRRHALGLLAGVSIMPSRGFANVAPPRSEIREDLARHFADEGTAGTFVGYKTDDYLIIASDKDRSGQAMLPASTFKIPNSVIALETGVVGDPDKDVFKWDGVVRSIEGWNRDHTHALGDRRIRRAGLSGDRPAHRRGADAEICRSV